MIQTTAPAPNVSEVVLHKVRMAVVGRLGENFGRTLEVRDALDAFSTGLAVQIVGEVLRESRNTTSDTHVTQTVAVPLTWWDHLLPSLKKAFPTFLKRFTPRTWEIEVALTQTHITEIRTCPHLDATGREPCIRFMSWQTEGGTWNKGDRLAAWQSVEADRKFRERWPG